MHSAVVDVGRDSSNRLRHGIVAIVGVALGLLLVANPVLSTSLDTSILGRDDGLLHGYTAEVRVGTESFPVSPCIAGTSERSCDRTEEDLCALSPKLLAHGVAALVHNVLIPCCTDADACGEDTCVVCNTESKRTVVET
jgi:hypothetical protein